MGRDKISFTDACRNSEVSKLMKKKNVLNSIYTNSDDKIFRHRHKTWKKCDKIDDQF